MKLIAAIGCVVVIITAGLLMLPSARGTRCDEGQREVLVDTLTWDSRMGGWTHVRCVSRTNSD